MNDLHGKSDKNGNSYIKYFFCLIIFSFKISYDLKIIKMLRKCTGIKLGQFILVDLDFRLDIIMIGCNASEYN